MGKVTRVEEDSHAYKISIVSAAFTVAFDFKAQFILRRVT
jgi:hypothetical protein